jgi:hypothetical protein
VLKEYNGMVLEGLLSDMKTNFKKNEHKTSYTLLHHCSLYIHYHGHKWTPTRSMGMGPVYFTLGSNSSINNP